MWKLDHKEGRVPKNWCFWTMVLDRNLESSLGCKEIKSVNPKGNQPWIFSGRTDVESPKLWPVDVKNWLIGKDPDAGKDWGKEENGVTEDEMVVWHQQLNGHEFEQSPGDNEGQCCMVCCSPCGHGVGHNLVTKQQQSLPKFLWEHISNFTRIWYDLS